MAIIQSADIGKEHLYPTGNDNDIILYLYGWLASQPARN